MASRRFTWPLIILANVGALESARDRQKSFAVFGDRDERETTFEISHERLGTAVESIDDHLSVCRAGDLDSAVGKTWCGRGAHPGWVCADIRRLGQKFKRDARVGFTLGDISGDEETLPGRLEGAMECR